MGPIGAIICGHIGDTLGRRKILVWALACVSISSFFISILPTYDQIGIAASILFVIFRCVQMLGFGGDAVGLTTFILEESPIEHRGFFGGLMSLGGAIGVCFASLEIALLDPLGDPLSAWKWRSPLSLGIIGIVISIYFYRLFGDSAVFQHYEPKKGKNSWPLFNLLKFRKTKFAQSVGVFSLAPIINLVIFGFIPYLGLTSMALSSKFVMWVNTLALVVFSISAPVFGFLSDKIGRKPILFSVYAFFFILSYRLFYLFELQSTLLYVSIQVGCSFVSSAYYGVAMTTNIEHLPTHLRYTGVALSFALAYSAFGGITGSHIINSLNKETTMPTSISYYLIFGAIIAILSTWTLKEETHHSLEEI